MCYYLIPKPLKKFAKPRVNVVFNKKTFCFINERTKFKMKITEAKLLQWSKYVQ